VPGQTAVYKKLWSLGTVRLIVPADEKLEAFGRNLCESKSSLSRVEGARILQLFKNDKNVAILKKLLSDDATSEKTSHELIRGHMELVYRKKEYHVRQAAYKALRELGVKVEKPVLEELLEGSDDPEPLANEQKP
jgi:HEAT repeat protein